MTGGVSQTKTADRLHFWMLGGFVGGLLLGLLVYSIGGNAPWISWIAANVTGLIGQINAANQFDIVWKSDAPIEPDPFLEGYSWWDPNAG